MASASITFVLTRLADQAVKEAALLRGVDKDIRLLRDKLEWLQAFIQHADQERRKGANGYIALWVRQTRDVAHEVEDVLDEFLRKADLDRLAAGRSAWGRWLKLAASFTTQVAVRHDLRERMDGIKDRLKEISDNVDKYWSKQLRSNASSSSGPNASISAAPAWDEEIKVLGFEDKCQDLENHLLSSDRRRSVISIIGESGIGKSTLAWKVYDSSNIMKKFDVRVWINVPPQIKENDILYFIYKRLCPEMDEDKLKHSTSTTQSIHNNLSEYLRDKRYLVMVDGLANFTNWNSILQSLPDKGNGSRVMIITRLEENEARYADPKIKPFKIDRLEKLDSENLFCNRVLIRSNSQNHNKGSSSESLEPDQMEKVSKNIYEITQGVPLAIVLLAGLLRTKANKEWDKVFKQLRSSEEPKHMKRILALCFDDLPSRLKSCFLYFAGMPENLIYNARRIVRLWAAEGFLKPKKGKTMEDIGQSYLKELISRGMIQLVKKDINGGVWLVAIHDRLHAFAQLEAQEASFLEVHDNADVLAPASIRRLYLQNYMQSYIPMDTPFPKLRSILCDFAEERSENLESVSGSSRTQAASINDLRHHALSSLQASKFLRVIDLRGLRIKKVPHAIGDLIHVRYLGLRSRNLATLPPSIGRLINLQTLDIKRTEVVEIAEAFWEIPTLRHVVANKLKLPKFVGALNNMQTLTGLVCCHPWSNNKRRPLNNMVFLRNLEISGLNENHWEGLEDAFKKLESLLYLHLAGKGIPSKLFTNFTLRRLQILELYGEINTSGDKVDEQYTLPNVTRIVLKESEVDKKFMDKIGELPSLKELVMSDRSYVGEKLVFSDSGFNSITNLVVTGLPELQEWEIQPHSIPKVRKITVGNCPMMRIKLCIEGDQGLQGLMSDLKEVAFWNMPDQEISIEPENKDFREKINNVTMNTKSDDITSAMQRKGRWRAGMIAGDIFQN
nr:unnamed protein product [Digitaria exilis]